jgi:molybdenum cofactor cytidylyltransferase
MGLPLEGGQALIAHVASTFKRSGADPVVVVTGAHRSEVESALVDVGVLLVHNQDYEEGGMLRSVKVGLRYMAQGYAGAVLVCPGDHPKLEVATVKAIIAAWEGGDEALLAPSFRMRRGHPLLIGRAYWEAIQGLPEGSSLRDFLKSHAESVGYVEVEDPGIFQDLDTPEDYQHLRGGPVNSAG